MEFKPKEKKKRQKSRLINTDLNFGDFQKEENIAWTQFFILCEEWEEG